MGEIAQDDWRAGFWLRQSPALALARRRVGQLVFLRLVGWEGAIWKIALHRGAIGEIALRGGGDLENRPTGLLDLSSP